MARGGTDDRAGDRWWRCVNWLLRSRIVVGCVDVGVVGSVGVGVSGGVSGGVVAGSVGRGAPTPVIRRAVFEVAAVVVTSKELIQLLAIFLIG